MLLRHSSLVWTFKIILTTWHSVDGINADICSGIKSFWEGRKGGDTLYQWVLIAAHFGAMWYSFLWNG